MTTQPVDPPAAPAQPPTDPAVPPPSATEPPKPAPPATPPATPPTPPAEPPANEDPAAKITRLEAEVKAARLEAGKSRITAKENAAAEARNDLAQKIGVALGLVKDEPVDPEKLTQQLAEAGAESKQAKVELAVFRAAAGTEADPVALLDSRTFLDSVKNIDPSDAKALGDAIAAAVKTNPRLGQAPTPGMKPNPAQGGSASPPMGLGEQIAAAQKAGNMREVMRLKSAQALQPNQ